MMDSPSKDKKILELQAALQKLKESEIKSAGAAAQYAKLESVFRNRLKSQFINLAESPSRNESNTSCTFQSKSISRLSNASSTQSKTESKPAKKKHPNRMPKKTVENPGLSGKSVGDVSTISSSEQARNSQLQNRIRRCRESIDGINVLSERLAARKKKFSHHLEKLNSETWNTQKQKNPLVAKLNTYLDSS